jgi:DNA-binding MarR family transcriptional regulator
LVRRAPDPADGRRARVLLTDRARALEAPLVAAARAVNATATKGFDDGEVDALIHSLTRLIGNLEGTVET